MTSNRFLTTARRGLAVVAGAAALAVPIGTLAPGAASADTGTAPYVAGYPDPQLVDQPISFDFYRGGSPTPTCAVTGGSLPPGVYLDDRACGLRGTTFLAGIYAFTVTATNGIDPAARFDATLEVDGPPVIFEGQPGDLTDGVPYSYQFVSLGLPAATFDAVGSLPPGITLDDDGLLHGTPTSAGDYPITIEADNTLGADSLTCTLHVGRQPLTLTGAPPAAVAGVAYDFRFDAAGYPGPTLSITAGQLPDGLYLVGNGISGIPSTVSSGSPVTVTASNGVDPDVSTSFTIPVTASAPAIWATPAMAHDGLNYSWHYGLGGTPRPTTSVTSGALPPGLSLDSDGWITGVPSAAGHYEFTVTADNGSGIDASINSTMDVSGGTILFGGFPPAGNPGTPYSFQFTAQGRPAPTVTATGDLPPGLTLSPSGLLSGIPTSTGSYAFTVTAANGIDPPQVSDVVLRIGTFVTITGHRAPEGNRGTKAFTFAVTLSTPVTTPVTVHWATANGSAKAGTDYMSRSGTVTFQPGELVETVTVPVKGDRTREADESFTVRLSRPVSATLGRTTATGTIVNDD